MNSRSYPHIAILMVVIGFGCDHAAGGVCAPGAAFPPARFVEDDGIGASVRRVCIDADDLALEASSQTTFDAAVARLVADNGLLAARGVGCQWSIKLTHDGLPLDNAASAARSALSASGRWAAETIVVDAGDAATTIEVDDAQAALNALRVLLASGGIVAEGTVVDGPTFTSRGIIEASYASPMSEADRSTTIALLGRLRGNVYVYGPKSDPFANEHWADLYPPDELKTIANAAEESKSAFLDFYWAVSPGWRSGPATASIEYGNDDDFERLKSKLDQLRAVGIDHFALFVDDIRADFAWPTDAATFGSLAAAHAFLANRLEAYVAAVWGTDLWFVGTHYSSDGDWLDYNTTLGDSLDPRVTVLWTGDSAYSQTITAADLAPVDAALRRNVAIWDNSPFHVLPLGGRTADLANAASGYLANTVLIETGDPIEDYWAVLGTIADYAWAPDRYEPMASITQWARVRPCVVAQSEGR